MEVTRSGSIQRSIGNERVYRVGLDQVHARERRMAFRASPRFVQIEPADQRSRNVVRSRGEIERLVDFGRVGGHDQTAPGR